MPITNKRRDSRPSSFHVKQCPSLTCVLTDDDLARLLVRAMLQRHHIEVKFRALYASVSFS